MRMYTLLFISIIFSATILNAQGKITKISSRNQDHYISTKINCPIAETYQYENISEPIVSLNGNGTGVFQNKDLSIKE